MIMRRIVSSIAGLALVVAVLVVAASAQTTTLPVTPQPYPPAPPITNLYLGPQIQHPTGGVWPYVAGMKAYSAETNNMSLDGYLRALVFQQTGKWISLADAERVINMQKAQN
jgi:hypothetical protein